MKKNTKNLLFISSSVIAGSFVVASTVSMNPTNQEEINFRQLSLEPKVKITISRIVGQNAKRMDYIFVPESLAKNMANSAIAIKLTNDYWHHIKNTGSNFSDPFFFDKWIQQKEKNSNLSSSHKRLSSSLSNLSKKINIKERRQKSLSATKKLARSYWMTNSGEIIPWYGGPREIPASHLKMELKDLLESNRLSSEEEKLARMKMKSKFDLLKYPNPPLPLPLGARPKSSQPSLAPKNIEAPKPKPTLAPKPHLDKFGNVVSKNIETKFPATTDSLMMRRIERFNKAFPNSNPPKPLKLFIPNPANPMPQTGNNIELMKAPVKPPRLNRPVAANQLPQQTTNAQQANKAPVKPPRLNRPVDATQQATNAPVKPPRLNRPVVTNQLPQQTTNAPQANNKAQLPQPKFGKPVIVNKDFPSDSTSWIFKKVDKNDPILNPRQNPKNVDLITNKANQNVHSDKVREMLEKVKKPVTNRRESFSTKMEKIIAEKAEQQAKFTQSKPLSQAVKKLANPTPKPKNWFATKFSNLKKKFK